MFYTPQVDLYTTELLSLVVHIIYFNGLLFFVIFYIYSQNTQLFEIPSDKLLLATCDVLKCKTEFFFCSHHGDTRPGFSSEINPIHNWYKCLIVVNKLFENFVYCQIPAGFFTHLSVCFSKNMFE